MNKKFFDICDQDRQTKDIVYYNTDSGLYVNLGKKEKNYISNTEFKKRHPTIKIKPAKKIYEIIIEETKNDDWSL